MAACAGAAALAWVFDAPTAGALVMAAASPGILVTLYEILRVLDDQPDDATRRTCRLALLLLLVPLIALMALLARLGGSVPWKLVP